MTEATSGKLISNFACLAGALQSGFVKQNVSAKQIGSVIQNQQIS